MQTNYWAILTELDLFLPKNALTGIGKNLEAL